MHQDEEAITLKVALETGEHICRRRYLEDAMVIIYDSIATVGEIRVYRRADFQSGSRVLKKVF